MGAQHINIGDKFGDWEVIEYDDNTYLICRCSCGIVRRVNRYDLLNGKSKSCGHGKNSFKDLKGQYFGEWEVLEYTGDRRWLCRCSCGTVKEVKTPNLVNGLSKSCGSKHKVNDRDIIGKRFGNLEVIKRVSEDKDYSIKYLCRCDCGKYIEVYRSNLLKTTGGTRSCGCQFYQNGAKTRINNGTTAFRTEEQINILASKENFEKYLREFDIKPTVNTLMDKLNLGQSAILYKIHAYNVEDLVDLIPLRSSYEDDIIKFIQDNTKVKVVNNDRTVLDGAELDIYIPEKKLAIEFNGNYWHDDEHKSSNYHKHKTLACGARGIHLVTIFEYEWNNKILRDKLKNILLDLISDNIETIQARKTVVREISNSDAIEFCNKYHLQNGIYSRVNIGEFYNNELVGVMSFSIPRFNSGFDWEISRLCFKGGVKVIGGADKMFKMFLRKYNPYNVISYCDISKFVGIIYRRIGFQLTEITSPGYIWVDKHNDVLSRYKTQKHKLIEQGLGTEDETEDSIMKSLGYHKVYNCGNARYEYYNDKK